MVWYQTVIQNLFTKVWTGFRKTKMVKYKALTIAGVTASSSPESSRVKGGDYQNLRAAVRTGLSARRGGGV